MDSLVKNVRTEETPPHLTNKFQAIYKVGFSRYPLLILFYTGTGIPEDCIPMKRSPAAPIGFPFGEDFAARYAEAISLNESVHDGAVLFGRSKTSERYRCMGWSCRIASRFQPQDAEPNRGSAYNSAISISGLADIDCVFLLTAGGVESFINGALSS